MAMTGGATGTRKAFLVAPLVAPALCVAGLLLIELAAVGSIPSVRSGVSLVFGVFAVGTPIAYAAALLAGAPIYYLLRRIGLVRRWTLWAGGFAIGVTVALLLAPALRGELFSIPFPWWAGGTLGLACAEVFLRMLTPGTPES
jgi:hypothetical protein